MADKRITELQRLNSADAQGSTDVLAIADVSAAETKKITLGDAVAAGLTGGIPDGSIPGSKIQVNSITSLELGPDSVGGSELSNNSVDKNALIDGAVSNEKLSGGITGDKLVDQAITATQLASNSVDGGVHIKSRSIPADALLQNTLTADEIAPNAIGSSELSDGSVDTAALLDGSVTSPKLSNGSVTDDKLSTNLNGNKIGIGTIPMNRLNGSIDGSQISEIGLNALPLAPPNTVLAGPASGGTSRDPVYRAIVSADLPAAAQAAKGGVSIPTSGGLSVSASGAVGISNTVIAGGNPFVNYNEHGLITSSRPLSGNDLPAPSGGNPGAVKPGEGLAVTGDGTLNVLAPTLTDKGGVLAGDGITIAADGRLSQSTTGITPGTYTKVTVDSMGNAIAGAQLETADLPDVEWLSVVNVAINSEDILDRQITRAKLADYAVSYIQEDQPSVAPGSVHVGCLWFQESTATLSMWNGNSFMSVGIGRLSAENLRFCGLFNAETGLITAVTQFGTSEGFEDGDAIPDPSDDLTGVYFLADTPGAGINKNFVTGISFDAGDWLVCNGSAAGWARIDTANSGGGGSNRLDSLLDVDVTTKQPGDFLQYQADGKWKNVAAFDCGDY